MDDRDKKDKAGRVGLLWKREDFWIRMRGRIGGLYTGK